MKNLFLFGSLVFLISTVCYASTLSNTEDFVITPYIGEKCTFTLKYEYDKDKITSVSMEPISAICEVYKLEIYYTSWYDNTEYFGISWSYPIWLNQTYVSKELLSSLYVKLTADNTATAYEVDRAWYKVFTGGSSEYGPDWIPVYLPPPYGLDKKPL